MPPKQRQWNSTLPRRKKAMARSQFKRPARSIERSSSGLSRKPRQPKKNGSSKAWKAGNRKKTLGAGQKTREWKSARAKLKVVFEKAGITTCELRMSGCWRNHALGFAHSLKRRFIVTPQQLEDVVLACNHCHDIIEVLSHEKMEAVVKLVIESRSTPVETIFDKIEEK